MDRLEKSAHLAKKMGVQLLSFPELYVPGYTLSPEEARKVAEYKDGPSITRARRVAKELNMAMLVPYAEKVDTADGTRYYDSIAVISETGALI
ncbi:MAG: nitrilase, partial [Deltaproteobacteria bacterium]|nr:nitrilase [Deltaproteobacteria bacterium]